MISQEIQSLALVTDWSKIKTEQTAEGIKRQMVIGEDLLICRFTFDPFIITEEHAHPQEQMTLVVKGRVIFMINGKVRIAQAGDVLHFPPNNRHGATMLGEEVVLIDIFSLIRERFSGGSNF